MIWKHRLAKMVLSAWNNTGSYLFFVDLQVSATNQPEPKFEIGFLLFLT